MEHNQPQQTVSEKMGRLYLTGGVAATTMLFPLVSHAADVPAPTLDLSGSGFATNLAIVLAFAVTAGLGLLGLSSTISLLRKSRGAVR